MAQAHHDLADARFAALGERHALASFLAHQVGEKSVSAYLYARGADDVWGHALADLCEDAIALDPSFDLIKSLAVLLDKHYHGTRYPSALPGGVPWEVYEAQDAERAIAIAQDVVEFVEARLRDIEADSAPG
jgi:HEPN domain-containing protein